MKNLLSLTQLTKSEISHILELTTQMRRIVFASYKKGPQLSGSVVAGLWKGNCPSSTAFALASQYLSGSFLPMFDVNDKLEYCKMLDDMGVNTVVVASQNDNLCATFSQTSRCNVINGGSSQRDPIGVLADIATINAKLDGLRDLSVLAVGNRDTNKLEELNYVLQLFGSNLVWHLPAEDTVTPRKGIVIDKRELAFSGADCVIDLGLSTYASAEKYYGSVAGIPLSLINKASINCPLLGARTVVDGLGVKDYSNNAVSSRQGYYVSVAMAILYLMQQN